MLVVVTFPFLWVFPASFKPKPEVYEYPPKFIFRPTVENYTQALIREKFYTHFVDSAVVTLGSTSIALMAGSLVAYGIARHRLGGTPFRFFLLAMRTLTAIAIVIPIYTMFRELRQLDTYWALILVYPVYMTPLAAWIMVGFFREIPREIEDAALIDGCSTWGLFWRVVVPVAATGLVVAAILDSDEVRMHDSPRRPRPSQSRYWSRFRPPSMEQIQNLMDIMQDRLMTRTSLLRMAFGALRLVF